MKFYTTLSFTSVLLAFLLLSHTLRSQDLEITYENLLDSLYLTLQQKHISPFWINPSSLYTKIISDSRHTIQEADSKDLHYKAYTAYLRVIALTGDGHSELLHREQLFGMYPIRIEGFDDGFYITGASKTYENLLGVKIISVDNTSVAAITEQLKSVIPHGNRAGLTVWWGNYFRLAGLLYGLGISKKSDQMVLTYMNKNGQLENILLKSTTPEFYRNAEKVSLFDYPLTQPLHRTHSTSNFWSTVINPEIYYLKINLFEHSLTERFDAFVRSVEKDLNTSNFKAVVVDIRNCPGGNNMIYGSLINVLQRFSNKTSPLQVFIIQGNQTFSAAISFIGEALNQFRPILIGQAVSGRPNHPGDAENYSLGSDRLQVRLSRKYWINTHVHDTRETIEAEIEIPYLFSSLSDSKDSALEYIKNYKSTSTMNLNSSSSLKGRYQFDLLRAIEFDGGVATITGFGPIRFALHGDTLKIPQLGLHIVLSNGSATLISEGPGYQLPALAGNIHQPLELLYGGQYAEARKIFLRLKAETPHALVLQDNNLLGEVMRIFYYQRDIDKAIAFLKIIIDIHPHSQSAKNILEIAERLKSP